MLEYQMFALFGSSRRKTCTRTCSMFIKLNGVIGTIIQTFII